MYEDYDDNLVDEQGRPYQEGLYHQRDYGPRPPNFNTVPRRRRKSRAVNAIFMLAVAVVFVLIALAGYTVWTLNSGIGGTQGGTSPEEVVNDYNAKNGITINGETLTPSNGNVDPTVEAFFNSQGASTNSVQVAPTQGVIPVSTLDASGCVSGQVVYNDCWADSPTCSIAILGQPGAFTIDKEQSSSYQEGMIVQFCK